MSKTFNETRFLRVDGKELDNKLESKSKTCMDDNSPNEEGKNWDNEFEYR